MTPKMLKFIWFVLFLYIGKSLAKTQSKSKENLYSDFHKYRGLSCDFMKHVESDDQIRNTFLTQYIKQEEKTDPGKDESYKSFISNYCSSAKKKKDCEKCFKTALYDYSKNKFCFQNKDDEITSLRLCYSKYHNEHFSISNDIISERKSTVVNLSSPPYNKCEKVFKDAGIPKNMILNFPVSLKNYPQLMVKSTNFLLALFLDAYVNKPTGLTCENIASSGLLQYYDIAKNNKVRKPHSSVTRSYESLRSKMCKNTDDKNEKKCKECFKEADSEFINHLYNTDLNDTSFSEDFSKIHSSLKKCLKNPSINSKYIPIAEIAVDTFLLWKQSFEYCSSSLQGFFSHFPEGKYKFSVEKNLSVVYDVIALNYFSFVELTKQEGTSVCEHTESSMIVCAANQIFNKIDTTHADLTESERMKMFAANLGRCWTPKEK